MQKKCKPFKFALCVAALVSSSLWADDVRINVSGEITAQTCSVVDNGNRTIRLDHLTIDQVSSRAVGVVPLGFKTESVELRCPAAHGITVNMADTGNTAAPSGREYLANVSSATDRANNVGTHVEFLTDFAAQTGESLKVKTDLVLTSRNNTGDFVNGGRPYGVKASYYLIGAGSTVTPGGVRSTMTLTFTYN